jgi:hypothetical protein
MPGPWYIVSGLPYAAHSSYVGEGMHIVERLAAG